MTLAMCSYCGTESDSRLVKKVEPPAWEDGGMACAVCRFAPGEIDAMHEQDRIDAARWRALRGYGVQDDGGRIVGYWLAVDPAAGPDATVVMTVDHLGRVEQVKHP